MMRIFAEPHPLPSPLLLPGRVGVSPSPSNCSSPDNTSSVCTVNGTRTSLTLCVDFVKYPEHAKRHAQLNRTIWKQVVPYEENMKSIYCPVTTRNVPGLEKDTALQGLGQVSSCGECWKEHILPVCYERSVPWLYKQWHCQAFSIIYSGRWAACVHAL